MKHLIHRLIIFLRNLIPFTKSYNQSDETSDVSETPTPESFGKVLFVSSLIVFVSGHVLTNEIFDIGALYNDIWANIAAELGSIAITILIVGKLYEIQSNRIEKMQRESERKLEEMRRESERRLDQKLYAFKLHNANTSAEREAIIYEMDAKDLLEGANLSHLDLTGMDLRKNRPGTPSDPGWGMPNPEKAHPISLKGVQLGQSNLTDVNLTGIDLTGVSLEAAIIENTIFDNTDLRKTYFGMYARMKNVSFRHANLENVEFNRCHIDGADFTDAKIRGLSFYRTGIANMILPNGKPLKYAEDIEEFGFRISIVGWRGLPKREDAVE